MNTGDIGKLAAELMDKVAEEYKDDPTAEVGIVGLVVEVKGTHVDEDGEKHAATWIDYQCSDSRIWIQLGLFDSARRAALGEDY